MFSLKEKLFNLWFLLSCAYILIWRCTVVVLSSLRRNVDHRNFVNRFAMQGAKKLLITLKTRYQVDYETPLVFNGHSYIFMSNHQSLFDIPLIYATIPGTIRFVTKAELFRIPIFGRALKVGECVPVYRNNPAKKTEFIQVAKEKLMRGVSLWIFPEGTRSHHNALLPFKTGGFHLAQDTATQIVPVAIINTRSIMPPKRFKLFTRQNVAVRVGKPIDPVPFDTPELQKELIQKVRLAIEGLLQQ